MAQQYNQIFDEEIYESVNQDNKFLLEDYMLELKSKGRAEKTISQYAFDIRMMYCYIHENMNNKSILNLKKRDFRNFFLMLQETGKSSSRINRVQSSIRNLLEFAVDDEDDYEDYIQNPMKKIKSIEKMEVRNIVFLTDEQVTFLINYLIEHDKLQQALYVSLSYDSAGRRNEIHQVTKDGFLDDGVFKTCSVIGKRAKQFPLMYGQRTKDIAKMYLEQRGEDNIHSLWITGKGEDKRMVASDTLYVYAVGFRTILENEYNEDIPMNSHSLRHSSLENYEVGSHHSLKAMGKDKLDLNTLRILANHENVDTTMSYLKNKDEDILNDLFGN